MLVAVISYISRLIRSKTCSKLQHITLMSLLLRQARQALLSDGHGIASSFLRLVALEAATSQGGAGHHEGPQGPLLSTELHAPSMIHKTTRPQALALRWPATKNLA